MDTAPTVRVMALHALAYCERLFFLEEVEEIRVADERVFEGRTLHESLEETGDVVELVVESAALGIRGKMDAFRRRDGTLFPVEHKRGRAHRTPDGAASAWRSDLIQAAAYAMLLEEHSGQPVAEARIRYHADNVTVRVAVTSEVRAGVTDAVQRSRQLARSAKRPPVTENERLCIRCSLAPVCLPEETRLAREVEREKPAPETIPVRLFPPDAEQRSVHVIDNRARIGRAGECLRIKRHEQADEKIGIREVSDLVIHGHAQVTTQALRLCAAQGVPVHYVTTTGSHLGTFSGVSGGVQRRLRQYAGLSDDLLALGLARRTVMAKIELQLRQVLRASRKDESLRSQVAERIETIRAALRGAARAQDRAGLRGHEGGAARAYFSAVACLVNADLRDDFGPNGRTRRPPRDPFNTLLSFGYALLHRDITGAILHVGLEPSFGYLHQARSSAYPLALDVIELFRVPMVDVPVLGAVNRRTFDPTADFTRAGPQVWLSDAGRRKMIEVYERRKHEEYRHPVIKYSLSFVRMIELEIRLLEKEWSGEPGLFARLRIR